MGGGDLQDVIAATDFLKATGYPDPKKLIAMGGSYGGYMTMMAVTQKPEPLGAGVPLVPFFNRVPENRDEDPGLPASRRAANGDAGQESGFFRDRPPPFCLRE